ncbi:MAG TPA: ROK family protein [Vicinamibacteria bacterium]|nr:ROK family protein [Vicinamibacteria bacterium]
MSEPSHAIAVDIGGTKVAVAVVLAGGELAAETTLPTESSRGFASGLARIREAVLSVTERAGVSASGRAGIGIGCTGPVDPRRGTIHNPYTLPGWDGADIVGGLRDAFACPVVLENDADAALVGECWKGAGRGFDPVVMLTFGTGVGGAALVGGRILRGVAGAHPELGHVVADPAGPPCYCGASGCLEVLASGTALGQAGSEAGLGDARQVLALAAAGEPGALRLRSRALAAVTQATFTVLYALAPARLVLGGGVIDDHYQPFAAAVGEAIARVTMLPGAQVSVARAELGNRAGLVGAARLVLTRSRRR